MKSFFQKKKKITEAEYKKLEWELAATKHQLSLWRKLYTELKTHDWFEIGDGGVIIAHAKNEPVIPGCTFGIIYTVPHLFKSCEGK